MKIIPWKEWCEGAIAQTMDRKASDIAAITMVLRSLHCKGKASQAPVLATWCDETRSRTASVSDDIDVGALELFPCVPKSGRIHKTSTHPDRVAIEVEQKQDPVRASGDAAVAAAPAGGAAVAPKTSAAVAPTTTAAVAVKRTAAVATKTTYHIHPEYKQP